MPLSYWIENSPEKITGVLEYLISRGFDIKDYPWHWTDEEGFNNRLIIPFYYQNNIVGWTARLLRDGKVKYISEQQPGYVFNLDQQNWDRKFVLVTEGPIDAICINGCAIMANDLSPQQALLLKQLNREVVIVPDRDAAGLKLVEQAIEYGFSVSMPEWPDGVKDINDAIKKFGKIYTMLEIVKHKESMPLKIQLRMKSWIG
jgi:DNA primase